MKKKYYIWIVVALLGTTTWLSSCSSDDDPKPTIIDEESIIESDEEAFALVNGGFEAFQDLCSTFTELSDVATFYGSSYFGNEDDNVIRMARLTYDETNDYPVWAWDDFYWAIGTANDAIEKINASPKVSAAAKTEAIARAKFIRGLAYSYLTLYFGEVPIRLTTDDVNTTRSSIDAVYAQVVSDLTDAEAGLPLTTSSPVLPSKGAAQALLARVYLQWASNPLTQAQVEAIKDSKTDPASSYNTSRLEKAIEYADKVITSGKYSLASEYANLFGRANESRAPEHIFTIQHDGDGIDVIGNHQYHCAWTYPFQTDKVSHIHPISTFEDWSSADKRKDFSVITSITDPKSGTTYSYLPPAALPVFGKGIDRSYTNAEWETIETNDVDQIEIRYAEVLLIKAEALVQLHRHGEAKALVNQLRQRAYGSSSHDLETVNLEDIQDEWLHEFIYEHKHWQNQVRWKTLISDLKKAQDNPLYDDLYATAGVQTENGVVSSYAVRTHSILHSKVDNANGHLYRYPIPVGLEGEDLGVRPQNPGY
ncbi:MAG: RagB/SusD family nutrient uptake outer membrane protein [Bacteroidaceae bacterium]|nr:RagB/SusD family nutrient uptake outer membrane protein [Bacteroidaceae bacterium]